MWANLKYKLLKGNGDPRKYITEKGNNTYQNICGLR